MMKGVKLKPLYLKENDIRIGPPAILKQTSSQNGVTELEDVPEIIRGHKLKKFSILKQSDEKEQVLKLGSIRARSASRGQIRKFTFKRLGTLRFNESSVDSKKFPKIVTHSIGNVPSPPGSFESILKALLTCENSLGNEMDAETKSISEKNREFQVLQHEKFIFLKNNLKAYKKETQRITDELTEISEEIDAARNEYNKKHAELSAQEARQVHLLTVAKSKPKANSPDINDCLLQREIIRKLKEECAMAYFSQSEELEKALTIKKESLDSVQMHKDECKKEVRNIKLTLVSFYNEAIRQGMDLRKDGLNWAVKALWEMGETVSLSIFPKFLDDLSACFILNMSKLEIEAETYSTRLEKIKNQFKRVNIKKIQHVSGQDLLFKVKDRIREISKSVVKSPIREGETVFRIEKSKRKEMPAHNLELHSELTKLRKKLEKIKRKTDLIANEEVQRVAHLFFTHKMLGFPHVLNCLVGSRANEYTKLAK